MIIPNRVKIGGLFYTCTLEKNIARDNNNMGSSCGNGLWIKVDESLPQQQKESTFIHELIEQINGMYELKLDHDKICTLESALYQIIVDNPEVFRWYDNERFIKYEV